MAKGVVKKYTFRDKAVVLNIPNIYSPVKLINFEFQKNCFFMIFLTDLL